MSELAEALRRRNPNSLASLIRAARPSDSQELKDDGEKKDEPDKTQEKERKRDGKNAREGGRKKEVRPRLDTHLRSPRYLSALMRFSALQECIPCKQFCMRLLSSVVIVVWVSPWPDLLH